MTTGFDVFISERPVAHLFGIGIHTTMSKASVDCPDLWKRVFVPRMLEISGKGPCEYHGPLYGISQMTDPQTGSFAYWAAMPASEGAALPEGMREIDLPAGLYAGCALPSLETLGEAYAFLYTAWPQSQNAYALNMQAPCFEYYDSDFCTSGKLQVYVPVIRKS